MAKRRTGLFQGQLLAVLVIGALMSAIVPGSSPGAAAAGKPHLTVGGKLDTEAQLLTKLYVLVLRKAGFDVTEKSKLGTNDIVHNAIVSGQIDLYPEFTATGLARLKLKTTHNDQKDYDLVKAGYQKQFHITWLAMSPLNDTYGICTTQARAGKLGTKVGQLAAAAPKLTVASPPDGTSDPNVLPGMKAAYGFTFGKTTVLDEALTFPAVQQGKADVNVCYTTSALIAKNHFVLLDDDRHLFPIYHPAPIVRDATLTKAPEISTALNALAPKLTTEVSQQLQLQVVNGSSVTDAAATWLKGAGLL
ncbi:MAG TPA: glycine betaine ABC transporter substrate-binding protein [bacterium]|nr:glycine betaine ABC transporter substrate-binding protein [bacterium]